MVEALFKQKTINSNDAANFYTPKQPIQPWITLAMDVVFTIGHSELAR